MAESSVTIRRSNLCRQQSNFARADQHTYFFANQSSTFIEIDARNSSPENWRFSKPDQQCKSAFCSNEEKGREEGSFNTSPETSIPVKKSNFLNSESSYDQVFNDRKSSQLEVKEATVKALSHKRLIRNNSLPEVNIASIHAAAGASESDRLTALSADAVSGCMTAKHKSRTEVSVTNSPGQNKSSSPGYGAGMTANQYSSSEVQNGQFQNSSELAPLELYEQNQSTLDKSNTDNQPNMNSNCGNNECENMELTGEEQENGGNNFRKMSSGDNNIYPWMKDSRQNQKKTQSTSVSSSGS